MGNVASSQGQLIRSGVRTVPKSKKRKKRRPLMASRRLAESIGHRHFFEQGREEFGAPPKEKSKKKHRTYLVTIIEEGLGNSKDKNYYSAEALQKSIGLFNSAKAYADHPDAIQEKTLPERSMRDLVGWYSDCFTDRNPGTGKLRLRGKLHFFPAASWLTDMIDTMLEDSTAKNLFGISINAVGKTRPAQMDGDMANYVESFIRVDSADVVTEPAARGRFDKMLESRRGSVKRRREVSKGVMRRAREAGVVSSEKAKQVADALVAAYHSDNPDEIKEAAYQASKVLHAASSVSGKGPGQVSEEQYGNIIPSGGKESMSKLARKKVKASGSFRRAGKKRFKKTRAAAGKGPDNETLHEPSPEDIASQIEEADVEDVETDELGEIEDYGDRTKYAKESEELDESDEADEDEVEEADEDEGFEDEGAEDEDEDEMGMTPPPSTSGSPAPLTTSEDDEDEDEMGELDDLEIGGEGEEAPMEDEEVAEARRPRRRLARASGRRRVEEAGAAVTVGKGGKAGAASLPKHAIGDYDEDYTKPSRDTSTSGAGKSYKIKTAVAPKNKLVRKVVHEANRRIHALELELSRLRESNRGKDRRIDRYQGIIRFHNTKINAARVLREAVKAEILPSRFAKSIEPKLWGLSENEQRLEVEHYSRLLESTREGAVSELMESVEGVGGRGTAVSWGSGESGHSASEKNFEAAGVPLKK